jgi:hypothetical protein
MYSAIPHELSDGEMANRRISLEEFIEIFNDDVINILLMTNKAHFHL